MKYSPPIGENVPNLIFVTCGEANIISFNEHKLRFIIYTRHFIPEPFDGFYAYRGDGRGFSCIPNEINIDDTDWKTNSSRVIISFPQCLLHAKVYP